MDIIATKTLNTNKHKSSFLDKMCAMFFFLSLVLNDTFGEMVTLNALPKAAILAFMVLILCIMLTNVVKISITVIVFLVLNVFWWGLSCFWTASPTIAFFSTLSQNVLFCFFVFIYFYNYKNYDLYFYAMFASGFLLMIYSFFTYGFDGFIEALQEGERMGYGITNANTYGKVFAHSVVAGLYILLFKSKKLLGLASIVFLLLAFSSGSKKSIVIIILSAAILLILKFGRKNKFMLLVIAIILFLIFYFAIQLPLFETIRDRLETFISGDKNYSDQLREDMIDRGIELFKQKPIAGWGIEAYATISGFDTYSHNNYVELLVNYGIIGLCLYYVIHLFTLLKLRYSVKLGDHRYYMILAVFLSAIVTEYGMVSYGIKSNWIMLGVAMAMAVNSRDKYVMRE